YRAAIKKTDKYLLKIVKEIVDVIRKKAPITSGIFTLKLSSIRPVKGWRIVEIKLPQSSIIPDIVTPFLRINWA
ncbi:hypothetical protein, partial [Oenococcus oeni]|uniref:hypothetical protein n=1 Tax=Oenococcus oeni TaxID=1247 RepID=UPI001FB55288